MGGYLHTSGRGADGAPALPGATIADGAAGGMHAAIAILAALLRRARSGRGEYLDVSVAEGVLSLMALDDRRAPRDGRGARPRPRPAHRPLRLLRRLSHARREVARGRRDRAGLLGQPVPRARSRAMDRSTSTTTRCRTGSAPTSSARLRDARPRRLGRGAGARRHLRRARATRSPSWRTTRTSRRAASSPKPSTRSTAASASSAPLLAGRRRAQPVARVPASDASDAEPLLRAAGLRGARDRGPARGGNRRLGRQEETCPTPTQSFRRRSAPGSGSGATSRRASSTWSAATSSRAAPRSRTAIRSSGTRRRRARSPAAGSRRRAMLSAWFRPHHWAPERSGASQPLQVHFDLKQALDLPEAVMTDNTIVFHEPVRPGDRLRTWQVLRSVSPAEAHQARPGPLLGDRRRVREPARRSGRHRELHGLRLPEGRLMPIAPRLLLGDVRPGDRLPELALRRHRDHRGAGRARDPRLAADAPRPGLRPAAQRRARHLPQHAEPGRLVRALPHGLDGPARAARRACASG